MASKEVTALLAKAVRNLGGFDKFLRNAKVISAGGGKCLVELEVTEDHVNLIDGLHGGCSATLVDSVSSWALATKIGPQFNHVSLDIHTTYLKGATIGDVIEIDANTLRAGKKIANLEVLIKNKATGELLVKGAQTKYILPLKES